MTTPRPSLLRLLLQAFNSHPAAFVGLAAIGAMLWLVVWVVESLIIPGMGWAPR